MEISNQTKGIIRRFSDENGVLNEFALESLEDYVNWPNMPDYWELAPELRQFIRETRDARKSE